MFDQPTFYICNDPERALGLEESANYHIVCTDNNPIIAAMRERGVKVFSLDEALGAPNSIFRNSNRLLNHPKTLEYINAQLKPGQTANIIVFKIAPNIEYSCQQLGFNLLNPSSDLNHKYENKISQYESLSPIGVNFPKTIVRKLGEIEFDELVEELGLPFVIQFDRGHTGNSTYFINSVGEFLEHQLAYPKRVARFAKKLNGEAWTLNACATRYGTAYGGLSYQLTGIPGLTDKGGATVGNDWFHSRILDRKTVEKIKAQTELIGNEMYRNGFKGLFGIDLVIEDDEPYIIEVNARQPASTSMHTKIMQRQGLVPLKLLHINEFTNFGLDFSAEKLKAQNKAAMMPFKASQIFKRYIGEGELIVVNSAKPGVYINGEFFKSGYSIDDLEKDDQYIILHVDDGNSVKEGGELARVQQLAEFEQDRDLKKLLKI